MLNRPTNRIQQAIYDALKDGQKLTVKELAKSCEVSEVYIRQQVASMMELKLIEKVDQRQPYMYQHVPIDTERQLKLREVTEALMAKSDKDLEGKTILLKPFIEVFRKAPKTKWLEILDRFEVIEQAIYDLDAQDKLIDTL